MKRRERGFTLLEVLIAVAIMSIGIVGALELFSGSLRLADDSGKQSQAVVLARALIDEELWRSVLEENERAGNEGPYQWTVSTRPVDRELVGEKENSDEFHDAADEMGLWMIEAHVNWETANGSKSLVFQTARIGTLPEQ